MAIVTFYNLSREQTGQTMAAVATATNMAIEHNLKILLISTSLNDNTIKDCFWQEKSKNSLAGMLGIKTNLVNQSGIEGLDRIARSNKISPDVIKNYTRVVLKNRLEILLGLTGTEEQYQNLCKQYFEIITLASKYYNLVIVDLDKRMNIDLRLKILKASDVLVPVISQRLETMKENIDFFSKRTDIPLNKAIFTIGKYDEKSKYNLKNLTRSYLKGNNMLNVIPYNVLLFEASQEGNMVDLILNFARLRGKDENSTFLTETSNLGNNIKYLFNQTKK